jgi:tyrosyl-tRNA synthetase
MLPADFAINRDAKYGGSVAYSTYDELEQAYANEVIYPLDLKNGVADELNKVAHISAICSR